ncbi:MAG: bestrophin family ion channel [Cytophagales bacterium]|nr:bestrophin family ion channel [Cytophagales bacterium]
MAFSGKRPPLWYSIIFDFLGTKTLRIISFSMLGAGLYTGVLDYLENYVLHVDFKPPTTIFTIMGTVLGLLLVFRTNTAYDRWWSGRILLSDLTANARSFAIKINAYLDNNDLKLFFAKMISNHAYAMKEHLREGIKWDEIDEIDPDTTHRLKESYHVPNEIINIVNEKITELYRKGLLTDPQIIELNRHADIATSIVGSCERIRTTPMPFSYRVHLRKYIFFFTLIMPFGFIHELNYWSIVLVMIIYYALAGLDAIGEEIEDPFGQDENDLPVDKVCRTIKNSVEAVLIR